MKIKISETNFIVSRALFWVAQPKQKKKDFSPDFVVMATFVARKFFFKVYSNFIFKMFVQNLKKKIIFIFFFIKFIFEIFFPISLFPH